ncbi:hypothetical protein BJ741DRAFT_444505 [Chytriomyces cf. hyalinus JEL632]|nr:hypothetical protein BJ741DRAFT_444505 [Chytriomyces cf. hyalinus JEL632]
MCKERGWGKVHWRESGARGDVGRKKKIHFSAGMDIDLLKEVVNEEPFAASHGAVTGAWATVASNLNTVWGSGPLCCRVTGPMYQKRFKALMDVFCKEELDALKASGTDKKSGQREEAEDERRD